MTDTAMFIDHEVTSIALVDVFDVFAFIVLEKVRRQTPQRASIGIVEAMANVATIVTSTSVLPWSPVQVGHNALHTAILLVANSGERGAIQILGAAAVILEVEGEAVSRWLAELLYFEMTINRVTPIRCHSTNNHSRIQAR
eukprot:CAMPEP_0169108698 /NCGR_PEP_ID=MMETSP1015-20121227/25567_1 /TAXON_ID=342587 /ORGANISM="Karlodinium micrum, Strain CCMP2283" /LENGTH=140 /DNA_ID=CAMNT_0009170339 /DNA_START=247 /DNA_END=669 /DNA_ORIENTATION=-